MARWESICYALAIIFLMCIMVPFHIRGPDHLAVEFDSFMERFNKCYDNDTVYEQRFTAFKDSLAAINSFNSHRKHNSSALYGITQYSDMTPEEFLNTQLQPELYKRLSKHHSHHRSSRSTENVEINFDRQSIPKRVDWREKGVVTDVYNQGACGACWAFCAVENMESMYAIKTGKLINLSVQQLIDCAGYKNDGCNGGDTCALLRWMKDFSIEVVTEKAYPLSLQNESCKMVKGSHGIQVKQFACQRLIGHEDYILQAISQFGPVSVAINALTWQNYLGGIIQFHCGGSVRLLNHAVQIVGYDLTAEIPHYIIRNSWGKDFGDDGYLYIAIGENLCGLANEVSILTVV